MSGVVITVVLFALGARAVFAAYPELLAWNPGRDLKDLLNWLTP